MVKKSNGVKLCRFDFLLCQERRAELFICNVIFYYKYKKHLVMDGKMLFEGYFF